MLRVVILGLALLLNVVVLLLWVDMASIYGVVLRFLSLVTRLDGSFALGFLSSVLPSPGSLLLTGSACALCIADVEARTTAFALGRVGSA